MRKVIPLLSLAIVMGVLSIFMLAGCKDTNNQAVTIPKTLVGDWRQTNDSINGITMNAKVSPASIQIVMQNRDGGENFYWLGTFSGTNDPNGSYKIKSLADQDALSSEIFGSLDKEKMFSYKNGVLSFHFRMDLTGESGMVKLEKWVTHSVPTVKTTAPKTTSVKTPSVKVQTPPARVAIPKPAKR